MLNYVLYFFRLQQNYDHDAPPPLIFIQGFGASDVVLSSFLVFIIARVMILVYVTRNLGALIGAHLFLATFPGVHNVRISTYDTYGM